MISLGGDQPLPYSFCREVLGKSGIKLLFDTIVGESLVLSRRFKPTIRCGIENEMMRLDSIDNIIWKLKCIGSAESSGGDLPLPYSFCRDDHKNFGRGVVFGV